MNFKNKYFKLQYLTYQLFFLLNTLTFNNIVLSEQIPLFRNLKYRKEDIEALPVFICNTKDDCPKYSSGCINVKPATETKKAINICNASFICHGSLKCQSFESNNKQIFQLNNDNAEIGIAFINNYSYIPNEKIKEEDKRILHSCNNKLYKKGLCTTENCRNNSTLCLSGYCNDNVCMKRKLIKDYICRINYNDIHNMKMECKLSNQEPCTANEECDSNICHSQFCLSNENIKPMKNVLLKQKFKRGLTFLIYFVVFSVIIFSILITTIYLNSRYNNYKKL